MEFIKEVLKSVKRLDNEQPEDDMPADNEQLDDFDLEGDSSVSDEDLPPEEGSSDDEFDLDADSKEGDELDNVASQASEDPNRRGLIRTVPKAHLVYKRETEDGTFEELWCLNAGNLRDEIKVRKAILAGTDIPVNNTSSPDGKQEYVMWTSGNLEMIKINGLQS